MPSLIYSSAIFLIPVIFLNVLPNHINNNKKNNNDTISVGNITAGEPCSAQKSFFYYHGILCTHDRMVEVPLNVLFDATYCICSEKPFDALTIEAWLHTRDDDLHGKSPNLAGILTPTIDQDNVGRSWIYYCYSEPAIVRQELHGQEISYVWQDTSSLNGLKAHTSFQQCRIRGTLHEKSGGPENIYARNPMLMALITSLGLLLF